MSTTQYMMLFAHGTTRASAHRRWCSSSRRRRRGSANMTVAAPDACASTPTSSTSPRRSAPRSRSRRPATWQVDWSKLTQDSFGNTVTSPHQDRQRAGRLLPGEDRRRSADQLPRHRSADHTSLYTVAVPAGQKYVDLTGAKDASGATLGFTQTDGIWAVAVLCSTCASPGAGRALRSRGDVTL